MSVEAFHTKVVNGIMVQTEIGSDDVWVSASAGYTWDKLRGPETDPRAFLLLLNTQRRFDRVCHR